MATGAIESVIHSVGRLLQDAAVGDGHLGAGGAAGGALLLHLGNHVHTLKNLAEDNVLAVEPLGLGGADEELGSVGVGAGVGHGQGAGAEVLAALSGEGLVSELLAVDRLATSAVLAGEVAALDHEVGNDAVEGGGLVVQGLAGAAGSLLASAQSAEVLGGLGASISEQLEDNAASGLATDGNIEEHLGVGGVGRGGGHFGSLFKFRWKGTSTQRLVAEHEDRFFFWGGVSTQELRGHDLADRMVDARL